MFEGRNENYKSVMDVWRKYCGILLFVDVCAVHMFVVTGARVMCKEVGSSSDLMGLRTLLGLLGIDCARLDGLSVAVGARVCSFFVGRSH